MDPPPSTILVKLTFKPACATKCMLSPALQGFERVSDVEGKLATIESRTPWDGSDGAEVVEDEFDLADLMGDEDDKGEL